MTALGSAGGEDLVGGGIDLLVEGLHEAAQVAQHRAVELHACTATTLADSKRTVALAASGKLGARRLEELAKEVEGLRRAMETRAVIEQAKGILIATIGCDPDGAFALLAQQSQHENRKLAEVARELVTSKIDRPPPAS